MNPLIDIIPTAYRKYLYALVALGLYVYSVYTATKGHWDQFAISLATALVHTLAAANTIVTPNSDGIVVVGPTDPNALSLDPAPQANPEPAVATNGNSSVTLTPEPLIIPPVPMPSIDDLATPVPAEQPPTA